MTKGLELRPWTITGALPWNLLVHRKLPKLQGALWALQVLRDGERVGCAIVGRAARLHAQRHVLGLLRVAVLEGQPNACSMLYGGCSRAARGMGASGLVTYTHQNESGVSLRASNWIYDGLTTGGEHDRKSRPRQPALFPEQKQRWWAPWSDDIQKRDAA